MIYKLKHNLNGYYTHQPVLYKMLLQTTGDILELGCGDGSTELIHLIAEKQNRKVVTVESKYNWAEQYLVQYKNDSHSFIMTSDHSITAWNTITDSMCNQKWGLVFIDQGFWEARAYSFNKLKNLCDYVILHDCDYFPRTNLIGVSLDTYIDKNHRGKRDYSKDIKYWKEYFPNNFVEPTGPPTLLGSQFYNCEIEVDFSNYDVVI